MLNHRHRKQIFHTNERTYDLKDALVLLTLDGCGRFCSLSAGSHFGLS